MSVFSNQLFISPERPVAPFALSMLDLIDRLLRDAKIRYMLVGATARDLLLYHVFGHAVIYLRFQSGRSEIYYRIYVTGGSIE